MTTALQAGLEAVSIYFQTINAIIAGIVAVGLYRKKVMWARIVAYWCVLTLKNFSDLLMGAMK